MSANPTTHHQQAPFNFLQGVPTHPSSAGVAGTTLFPQVVSASDKVITPEHWETRKSLIQPSREVLNDIVMNYLVVQGYKEGAQKFTKEAGVRGKCYT
jgi:hypothetical protein